METKNVLSSGTKYSTLPETYIRPESQRPRLSEVVDCEDFIPVIDMSCTDRNIIVHQIGQACLLYGFFQVPFFFILLMHVQCFFYLSIENSLSTQNKVGITFACIQFSGFVIALARHVITVLFVVSYMW